MYSFARATLTLPQTGQLKPQTLCPPSWELDPGVQVRAGLSLLSLPPGRVDAAFHSLRPHGVVPLCVCVLTPSSYKDTTPMGSGPTLLTSFYLNPLFKDPISQYGHILRS